MGTWMLTLSAGRRGAIVRRRFRTSHADPWVWGLRLASRLVASGDLDIRPGEAVQIEIRPHDA